MNKKDVFRMQNIYIKEWEDIKKYWFELLVDWYLKKELINILKFSDNIKKKKNLIKK